MAKSPVIVALMFLMVAAVTFFWIPGVAIVLAVSAVALALGASLIPRVGTASARGMVMVGAGIAILGILVIPSVDPILGTVMLLVGGAVAAASPILEVLASRFVRPPR
jgi:uncharacterized membrane protein YgaE (UPF0421/DUF939 family)